MVMVQLSELWRMESAGVDRHIVGRFRGQGFRGLVPELSRNSHHRVLSLRDAEAVAG